MLHYSYKGASLGTIFSDSVKGSFQGSFLGLLLIVGTVLDGMIAVRPWR